MVDAYGIEVKISNPGKMFFPKLEATKLDLVRYYLAVMPGVMAGARERPSSLYRWPNGVDAPDDAFFQKRAPKHTAEWIETTTIRFPSGRSADMLVLGDAAHVIWAINLGCIDLNPWPVRRGDVDHPDELRVDLDPTPDVPYSDVCSVAPVVRDVLEEHGLRGYPKTSGKRGMHIYTRIEPRWSFTEVRRAALALAREVERRMPEVATTAWWKEERRGVFVDYNQNARDRTIASAYSVRPVPDATVSCPIAWDEVPDVDPSSHRLDTVPDRFRSFGDPGGDIDAHPGSLDALLALARRDEHEGLGDAPWPPNFPKADKEPPRVQPSRARQPPGN
ncbi:MAG: DNA polymerase domain-containing protein [Actinobacteria bacterium]|nr:DNA polymerase domain-containing protein [Actinomycetota bacterium]